jgi:hypothetical protein
VEVRFRNAIAKAALVTFLLHTAIVVVVFVVCQTDKDPDIVILWSLFFIIDFPVAKIVEMLQPSYNLPVAISFVMAGGFQWAAISTLIAFMIQKARRNC